MSRKGQRGMMIDGLIMPTKIRKRGCSSSSSSSSRIYSYRLNKRAILVGKNRAGVGIGLGRSRSNTPVPTWRTTAVDSPKYPQSVKSGRPISARRLGATLWEMNEMSETNLEQVMMMKQQHKKNGSSRMGFNFKGDRMHSGSLPPQLLDPPHSPTVSEKMVRSRAGSHRRRTPSISQRLMSADQNVGVIDSISNASFMEIESRSRPQTTSGSVIGCKNRLKDVSSALTTSKELLTIINRMWGHTKQPSSTMSLISALHTELERARLQVNQLIQEQRSDKNEVNYLIKCFAEEKSSWKVKEKQAVEAAIGSVAGELEVERKLRRRLESLNTKLGKEVAELKSSLVKVVKELESEKRAREITEQVCDELARNLDEDRAEVEKERQMLELADKLREERVQMKLSEAKHQFEEKNSDVNKLRKQLEVFLRTKRAEVEDDDDGEESKDDSGESDLHSIELDLNDLDKGYKLGLMSAADRDSWRLPGSTNEIKARNSAVSGHQLVSRGSSSIQRSISDGVEWGNQSGGGESLGLKNQLASSRLGLPRESDSQERSWPTRDPCGTLPERSSLSKTRTPSDVRAEAHSARRSKR
ncbi:hypothetical protein ACS0TY_015813 [Phlomoides rotata]